MPIPPFSTKSWSSGIDPDHDEYNRFADGIPPNKNGDYAFLQHLIRSLKSTGKGAIILPHGVLFRGNVEGQIRKNLIRKGYIKGIIGLPPNLFYGTGIPACIIVIDKENPQGRAGIFMIDASKGFMKDGNKNRLRHQDIHKIVDVFNRQAELAEYARLVSLEEIEANDYNLNIPRYIDSSEREDLQDIEAHLLGGIPNRDLDDLKDYWQVFPSLRDQLFTPNARPGYSDLQVAVNEIKAAILNNPEFIGYTQEVQRSFELWTKKNLTLMKGLTETSHPKEFIDELSESLLLAFANVTLIDAYDIYQHLMTYWTETMQDDVYMIVVDGWKANRDLIPPDLVVKRYFSTDQEAIRAFEAEKEAVLQQMVDLEEESRADGGYLEDAKNDKGKLTKAGLLTRLREVNLDPEADDVERQTLNNYLALIEKETETTRNVREAQRALEVKVTAKYDVLGEDEVKVLVVNNKWLVSLLADLYGDLDRVSQILLERIRELTERYYSPLPRLKSEVEALSGKTEEHLAVMGFIWN